MTDKDTCALRSALKQFFVGIDGGYAMDKGGDKIVEFVAHLIEAENARLRQERDEANAEVLATLADNADLRQQIEAAQKREPVAWSILNKRTGEHWYTHESRFTAQYYANEYSHRVSDGTRSMVVTPLYAQPIPTDEDAREAARYRWLRDAAAVSTDNKPVVCESTPGDRECLFGVGLDAAIDAAMAASPARDGEEGA